MPTRPKLRWICGGLLTLAAPARARAIPAFARLYHASCSMCHDPIPRLSAFGERFAANGYRFGAGQGPTDTIATGDPLLALPSQLRLAMRLDAYAAAYTGGRFATDFQTPYSLKLISGGPLTGQLSYYVYFLLSEQGATGDVEDAFLTWNDVAGSPVSVTVGQFQLADPMFAREQRLEYQDFAIYRARIGDAPMDLTYDRGLMLGADLAGFGLTAAVVNGNGSVAAGNNGRLDDDPNKSFLLHASRAVAPGLTLGALGYAGRQRGAATGGPTLDDDVTMLGGDVTVAASPLTLRAQYIHREDTRPTFTAGEPTAVTDGGFGELLLHRPGSRWYGVALYNLITTSKPLLDVDLGGPTGLSRYETLTGGGGYLMQRNVRVYGEATWDRGLQAMQWTLGLTMAF